MSERVEIGYVCRYGHFQFNGDPDGDTCGTKDVGRIYVTPGTGISAEELAETLGYSLENHHRKNGRMEEPGMSDVETESILALCHHADNYFHHECEACRFRQAAAMEHLRVTINAAIRSLTNPYRSQA